MLMSIVLSTYLSVKESEEWCKQDEDEGKYGNWPASKWQQNYMKRIITAVVTMSLTTQIKNRALVGLYHRNMRMEMDRHTLTKWQEFSWSGCCTLSIQTPFHYIRHTLGCGCRKQGLSRCIEPSPSLVLNHAAHNRSRQQAILNYSGAENIAAIEKLYGTGCVDSLLCWAKQCEFTKANVSQCAVCCDSTDYGVIMHVYTPVIAGN